MTPGKRLISHTEISQVLDCEARHAFSYTGHLTGGMVLKAKALHANLRRGRAWGRGVAAFHQADPKLPLNVRYAIALRDMHAALDEDAGRMRKHGFYDQAEHHDLAAWLEQILWHYASTTAPMQLSDPEHELLVPIPSRSGTGRVSNRYVFHGFLDGLSPAPGGRMFIVEYKQRDRLSDYAQVVLNRQYRRYAWAAERALDVQIAGVVVDERLNEIPKPPRWVKGKKKSDPERVPSHAKDQLTTPDAYREICEEAGIWPEPETVVVLGQRRWQIRHPPVMFTRFEIAEAGRELVSAAQLIAELDNGRRYPIRNAYPMRCNGCPFNAICPNPGDRELVDLSFERKPPKRDREPLEAIAA